MVDKIVLNVNIVALVLDIVVLGVTMTVLAVTVMCWAWNVGLLAMEDVLERVNAPVGLQEPGASGVVGQRTIDGFRKVNRDRA